MKLSNAELEAWIGLVKSQQLILNKVENELKKSGFPPLSWYDILLELDKAPQGSLRLNEISRKLLLSKYNITRLIDRLESKKLVSRESCPVDGRGIFACITPKGKKLRKRMWPVYYKAIKEHFFSHFSKKELKHLIDLISRIRSHPD